MGCCFFTSSIGKKVIMSITGFFLILFLVVHLVINLLILFDSSGESYNHAAYFMATNPIIKIVEPVLALGFVIHIIYATVLTLQNQRARPVRYAVKKHKEDSWASYNMFILGILVFVFLIIHIMDFFYKMKIDNADFLQGGHDAYTLVVQKFNGGNLINYIFVVIYVVGAILLGLHLRHGFWSAFQSLGWNNHIWFKRLKFLSALFAYLFAVGYACIPIIIALFL